MRKFAVVALAVVTLISLFAAGSVRTSAQSTPAATPNADCNPSKALDAIAKIKKTGDKDKDAAALDVIQNSVADYKAACAGLSWKGTKQQVIGPFDLPAGNFKAVVTTNGFFIADLKVLSGDCDADSFGALFNIMQGGGKDGAESSITSKGCRLVINTSNVSAPWKLDIEPLE